MILQSNNPISLNGVSLVTKREEIKEYFLNTFTLFEKIFEVLDGDAVFYRQSEPSRQAMIFYFGHTATFFINKLILMKIIDRRINPEFESLFAVGVDEMEWDSIQKSAASWPKVGEVREYRAKVKALVLELIETIEFTLPITQDSPMWIILMGIEHERIHLETSLVLHRQMPLEFIKKHEAFTSCSSMGEAPKNELITIDAQSISLGKKDNGSYYGWDNEYGSFSQELQSFEVSKYLVSNGEFMEFVLAGGYKNKAFWDDEGLAFLQRSGAKHPPFWVPISNGYKLRLLCEEIDLPMNWPVEVNALEAEAFCRFKSQKDSCEYLLPSESEYAAICKNAGMSEDAIYNSEKANVNFAHYSSSMPIDSFEKGGLFDVVGNVWQWSRTPIRGFDGFRVHEAYDDFSTPTFDEKHNLILGASWASSGNLIMKDSRYAFRKHFYQFAGFRYVRTDNIEESSMDIYESDELVSQYCEFQYGDEHFGVKNFALACAELAKKYTSKKTKALDLGCATGRASFELAKDFDLVEGIDFSARFIQVGSRLKSEGFVAFECREEGELVTKKRITLEELAYKELASRVSFWQGDACNLKEEFKGYDLVMATNLIDRLYEPKLFLQSVHERLNEGGVLMLTSPYTWQESSTKKEFWLGGFRDENGKEVHTLESLRKILAEHFELVHTQDLEFVIKETKRKFQHTVAEVSIWQKKN